MNNIRATIQTKEEPKGKMIISRQIREGQLTVAISVKMVRISLSCKKLYVKK